MNKSKLARELIKIRWDKTSPEDRQAHVRMMNEARLKKLSKLREKRAKKAKEKSG